MTDKGLVYLAYLKLEEIIKTCKGTDVPPDKVNEAKDFLDQVLAKDWLHRNVKRD